MSARIDYWSKMPTWWIETERDILPTFRWRPNGADELAGLMCYVLLVHRSGGKDVDVRVTYDDFMNTLSLSRAKVAAGLAIILERGLITKANTSFYHVTGIASRSPWGKLPCKAMFSTAGTVITMFKDFSLRSRHELNAVKLLLLICSRTNTMTGRAEISGKTIFDWSGIPINDIKYAADKLINHGIMHQERVHDIGSQFVFWGYRLKGEPSRHAANTSPDEWL